MRKIVMEKTDWKIVVGMVIGCAVGLTFAFFVMLPHLVPFFIR